MVDLIVDSLKLKNQGEDINPQKNKIILLRDKIETLAIFCNIHFSN